MSKLTKSFEQEFPLPFHIEEDERGEIGWDKVTERT